MAEVENGLPPTEPPKPALVVLDLGSNGGVFAPTTAAEAVRWIDAEVNFWSWIGVVPGGNFKSAVDQTLQPLREAQHAAAEALRREFGSPQDATALLQQASNHLRRAFVDLGAPHSSTPLAKRIDEVRRPNPQQGLAYMFARLPQHAGHELSGNLDVWRGFFLGIAERDGLGPHEGAIQSQAQALDSLRERGEALIGEKSRVLGELERQFAQLNLSSREAAEVSKAESSALLLQSAKAHDDAVQAHTTQMENIQKAFREKMALRAPVEYWETRSQHHLGRTTVLGWWSFGSMAVLVGALACAAVWVLRTLNDKGQPDAWRVGVVVLIGVIGVWAIRLIVRMFLSHIHLSTDAAERVTMVKTYLSLVEAGGTLSDDDRKLILQAVFRPASDGLVKDEGLPHPLLEMLTRTGAR